MPRTVRLCETTGSSVSAAAAAAADQPVQSAAPKVQDGHGQWPGPAAARAIAQQLNVGLAA